MLAGLFVPACLGVVAGFFVVLLTSEYPEAIRDFLVGAYRYTLRVEAYVALRPAFGLPGGSGAVPDGALVCADLEASLAPERTEVHQVHLRGALAARSRAVAADGGRPVLVE